MTRPTPYTELIQRLAPGYDPRHIEAFMRGHFSTLDHLSRGEFRREVKIAVACIEEGVLDLAEQIAQSYGF